MKQLFFKATILAAVFTLVASCSDDDPIQKKEKSKKSKYAMFIKIGKTDGALVAFDKIPEGDIKVADILKKDGGFLQFKDITNPGFAYNGSIYNTYNLAGESGIQKISINSSGNFEVGGFIPTGTDSRRGSDTFGVVSDTKGYYSNSKLSKTAIQIFNPETMERTGKIDFSKKINEIKKDLTGVVATAVGSFMIERDGKLFTQVFFNDKDNNHVIDKTYIAVVDTKTDNLEKIVSFNDYKHIGAYRNSNYVHLADNNDLYMSGFSGNTTDSEGFNYRIFRFKSGETEIDTTWDLDANADFGGPDFALGGSIVNGKMYIKLFTNAIDSDAMALWGKTYDSYEVDVVTKHIKLIPAIPVGYWGRSSNHGPTIYEGKPYFAVFLQSPEEEKKDGHNESFYSYDPATKKSKKVFTVIGGVPEHLIEL